MTIKLRKSYIFSIILILAIGLFFAFYHIHTSNPESAQGDFSKQAIAPETSSYSDYYRAKVVKVDEEKQEYSGVSPLQHITVIFITGSEKDKEVIIENQDPIGTNPEQRIAQGDTVIVGKLTNGTNGDQAPPYVIIDKYRLPAIGIIIAIFLGLALLFGRLKGATSIGGLAFSIFVLAYFIVPSIMVGKDPIMVSLVGSALIVLVSIFLAHGFNERSGIATISTFITLGLAAAFSHYFVNMAKLFGLGSEDAYYLQSGLGGSLNLKGLLFAGIIIGTLGILDDVTTTQTATIDEIAKSNKSLGIWELYTRGMSVGKEHIASLVNTLVLAYAGASLPLFILITISTSQPLWVALNSEFVSEELVRTLVGSVTLILTVPISTILAAYYIRKRVTD